VRSASLRRRLAVDLLLHFAKLEGQLLELREKGCVAERLAPQTQPLDLLLEAALLALEPRKHGRRRLPQRLQPPDREPIGGVAAGLRMLRRERAGFLVAVGDAALREIERFLRRDDTILIDVSGVFGQRGGEKRAEARRVALEAAAR